MCMCSISGPVTSIKASESFYRLLVTFSQFASFSSYSQVTWNAIVAFSEQCVANLVHVVLLLYLVVNSALERQLLARVRKELQSCPQLFHTVIYCSHELWYLFLATITAHFLQSVGLSRQNRSAAWGTNFGSATPANFFPFFSSLNNNYLMHCIQGRTKNSFLQLMVMPT